MTSITKEFTFAAAHRLAGHEGLCKNVHGHTYTVHVTITGPVSTTTGSSQGMVIDFKDVAKTLKEYLFDELDHAYVYNSNAIEEADIKVTALFRALDFKMFALPQRPTAEVMADHFSKVIKGLLSPYLTLQSVKVWETPTSFAEYIS